jgi:hypothetical protein
MSSFDLTGLWEEESGEDSFIPAPETQAFEPTVEELEAEEAFRETHVQIQQISITHDAIANFLVANPGKGQMAKAAMHFGVTRPWLSTLVHTDAFQAHLRNKQDEVFGQVIMPLKDKLAGVADIALDRLADKLEVEGDTRILADTADKLLNRLGYGPKPAGGNPGVQMNQNNYYVDKDILAEARERTKRRGEDENRYLPNAERVQDSEESNEGGTAGRPARLFDSSEES